MSDDELPPLDDFQQNLKAVQYSHTSKKNEEDYTKPNLRYIEDQNKQKQEIKQLQKKVQTLNIQVEKTKKAQAAKKNQGYAGLKKGFFSSAPSKKQEKISEIKVNKNHNPLEIKEVQEAMKMNNYLEETKKEWMTDNFLDNLQKNNKVQKLFTNPEFAQAITLFQTNPRQAMKKYGNNKEFMEGFQQFCQMMGNQFQSLAQQQKK